MAVAVKNASEAAPAGPQARLAISSLLGAAYVLGSIGVVFYALPAIWETLFPRGSELINPFVSGTILILLMLGSAVGLSILAARLVGPHPPEGLKAGVFTVLAALAGIAGITWCVGAFLERYVLTGESLRMVGLLLMVGVGGGLAFLFFRKFLRPGMEDSLIALEHQGWFSVAAYKKSQGQRVRRGTILGILILAFCGIFTLHSHGTLDFDVDPYTEGKQNYWLVRIPFTDMQPLVLLRDVRFLVPILLAAASLWFAYRLVNFPTFADFLIATEAEMNKVSWTPRKRLWQDTVVVLVTVILMTVFLFLVDVAWGFLLSHPWVGVLKSSPTKVQQDAREQPW